MARDHDAVLLARAFPCVQQLQCHRQLVVETMMDTHAVYLGMCVSRAITNLVCILSTLWCGPVFGQALYSNSRRVRSQFSFAVCCEYYTLYGVKVVCV